MHSTEIPDLDLDTITITECNCGTEVFGSFQLWVKFLHYVRQGYFRTVCMGTNVSKHVCAELPKGRVAGIYSVLSLQHPSFFGKPLLPHSDHILLLEPSIIIPCLPWPQGWEQYDPR